MASYAAAVPGTNTITYFMWGFQHLFRMSFQLYAERAFAELDLDLKPEALLVGVRVAAGSTESYIVCIEPEDGRCTIDLFASLEERVAEIIASHPGQNVLYGDARSMDRKPRMIENDSVRTAVRERVDKYDLEHGTISFCGAPGRVVHPEVGEYVVVPVLQFDRLSFEKTPRLVQTQVGKGHNVFHVARGLLDAVVDVLLADARQTLKGDEPGAALAEEFRRDPVDVLRSAGRDLMNRIGWVGGDILAVAGLFEVFTTISSMRHERAESVGGLIIAAATHPAVKVAVRFTTPVPLRTPNWARKVLELTSNDLLLLTDGTAIYGLGSVQDYAADREDLFEVRFTGFHKWDLLHDGSILMRTTFGVPGLPKARFDRARFIQNAQQMFVGMSDAEADTIWQIVDAASRQKKGTMVVITADAEEEARRLATQATPIEPQVLTAELVQQLTRIDGALLLDPHGVCHAIGVILDGLVTTQGNPARGSRFNSAIRYVFSGGAPALAVVISEDGTFDVLPLLPRRVRRSDLAAAVAELQALTETKNWRKWPKLRARLEALRFYFGADQAAAINAALKTLQAASLDEERIWVVMQMFKPSPLMNDSFLAPEEAPDDGGAKSTLEAES
ncbi:MAG: diadenylate cyclase [Acidobacteriota bacterium]